jgi:hypothetical protein
VTTAVGIMYASVLLYVSDVSESQDETVDVFRLVVGCMEFLLHGGIWSLRCHTNDIIFVI